MQPVIFPEANTVLAPPPGTESEVMQLATWSDGNMHVSCYELQEGELELLKSGSKIYLAVLNPSHPIISLGVNTSANQFIESLIG